MSQRAQLDKEAKIAVPPVSSKKSPKEYFKLGAGYLKMAGQCKKAGDFKSAYLNLSKYIVLITDRLPSHPDVMKPAFKDEYLFNRQKCEAMKKELDSLSTSFGEPPSKKRAPPPPPKKQRSSWTSWFSGKKSEPADVSKEVEVIHTTTELANNEDLSDLNTQERMAYTAVGTVVHNDRFQQKMGEGVARLAVNEQVQGRVADGVKNAALNREYQSSVGNMIAENTDNAVLKSLARNKKMQAAVGQSLAKTVGNKELQQKAGRAVAKAATDKRVQKAAATGFMMGVRGAVKGGKFFGKVGYAGTKMLVKEGIEHHKQQGKKTPPPPPKK